MVWKLHGCITQLSEFQVFKLISDRSLSLVMVPYSGNFSRTINFTVFVDFTATSKINARKSYYSIQMQWYNVVDPRNLIREMYHWAVTLKNFSLENYLLYGIRPNLSLYNMKVTLSLAPCWKRIKYYHGYIVNVNGKTHDLWWLMLPKQLAVC